ncbi:MAG: SDR family NAD(P)-dependent oxidoreductase [Terracidiphilus sp.]
MQRLAGKVAIVTGAGAGIGQGIAKRLGCEGAKVTVDCVGDPSGADETRRAINAAGGEGEVVCADVTSSDDIRKLVNAAWGRFGSADILVNNAGMKHKADFRDTAEADSVTGATFVVDGGLMRSYHEQ